jgi:SAM-dependent methyltransferase
MTNPNPEINASYDQVAAEFAARWGGLRLERALDAFARHVGGARRVLDLGCGPGRDLDFLAQLGCRVAGLDLSAGMLAEARRRMPDTDPGSADLVRADLVRPPFAAGCFDGVWACASLLHLPKAHLPAALAEIARLLPRPGVLYLALKGGQGEEWVGGSPGQRFFFAYYQPAEVEAALRRAGLILLETWTSADQAGRAHPWLSFVAAV